MWYLEVFLDGELALFGESYDTRSEAEEAANELRADGYKVNVIYEGN